MITIYVDPSDGNQVMAFFDNCKPGDPSTLTDQGFVGIEVNDDHSQHAELRRLQRDCQFNGTTATERTNPAQPAPAPRTRLDDLYDKLKADTITPAEEHEMLRRERGLWEE